MTRPHVVRADREAQVRIGARLRATRKARGLTQEQVAGSADLTTGFLSRLERDEASPSVATLVAICEVLGLRVGELFEPPQTAVIRSGEGRPVSYGGVGSVEQLITPGTQSQVQVLRSVIGGGGNGGEELYTLACDVEVVHVLRGRLVVVVDTEEHTLGPGDTLTFRGGQPHTWRNASSATACEVLWILTPAP